MKTIYFPIPTNTYTINYNLKKNDIFNPTFHLAKNTKINFYKFKSTNGETINNEPKDATITNDPQINLEFYAPSENEIENNIKTIENIANNY